MSTVEIIWYAFVVFACLFAAADWKRAVYVGLLVDVLRDPIRKLAPEEPVMITLSGAAVWLVIVLLALLTGPKDRRMLFRNYPGLRTAQHLLIFALVPAFGVSAISYQRGWLMGLIGMASYVIPLLGILAGFRLAARPQQMLHVLRFYVVINVLMLVSVPAEYLEIDLPALGGIDAVWIRHRPGYVVNLMCGWYRSPDIMGLHAAHVVMFSLLLSIRRESTGRAGWILAALWAVFCVLLSGRRKMIGIPLVFIACVLLLGMLYRVARINRFVGVTVIAAVIGAAAAVFVFTQDSVSEYTEYAGSIFTEGGERANALIISGTITTLKQAGLIGAGLGTATQGRYYAGVSASGAAKGWQEDGISRLFLEFGVPGVLLLICSVCLLLGAVSRALRMLPSREPLLLLQVGLAAVVAGDAASYAISHQQFSGDPVSALLVTMLLGMVLGLPGAYYSQRRPEAAAPSQQASDNGTETVNESLMAIARSVPSSDSADQDAP